MSVSEDLKGGVKKCSCNASFYGQPHGSHPAAVMKAWMVGFRLTSLHIFLRLFSTVSRNLLLLPNRIFR